MLSVLMPIFNEKETLPDLLGRILAVPVDKEVLIVDDCSTDGTRELLQQQIDGKFANVTVLYHPTNQGKGAAIRTAIPHAAGSHSIVQDGDLEYWPEDYVTILTGFEQTGADIVYGSRFTVGWPKNMKPMNRLVNVILAGMVRTLFLTRITDEATCYKAFKTDVLQAIPLTCRRFEFCPEVTAKAIRRGFKIVEVPVRYEARSISEGKKIRWTDGVSAIWTLFKWRFARF